MIFYIHHFYNHVIIGGLSFKMFIFIKKNMCLTFCMYRTMHFSIKSGSVLLLLSMVCQFDLLILNNDKLNSPVLLFYLLMSLFISDHCCFVYFMLKIYAYIGWYYVNENKIFLFIYITSVSDLFSYLNLNFILLNIWLVSLA